jgi:hypothetical protein
MRKIIGSCPGRTKKQTEFLVDWESSWITGAQARSFGRGAVNEWKRLDQAGHTSEHNGETLLNIKNPTSDQSEEKRREMSDIISSELADFLNADVNRLREELFKPGERRFLDEDQENNAKAAAEGGPAANADLTATQVMRSSFATMSASQNRAEERFRFDDILVQWDGVVDEEAQSHNAQPRKGQSVRKFLNPLFNPELRDDDDDKWKIEDPTIHLIAVWRAVLHIITDAPYLLTHTWPLMLITLFFDDNEITMLSGSILLLSSRSKWTRTTGLGTIE